MACAKCKQDVETSEYHDRGTGWFTLCEVCAEVFGWLPQAAADPVAALGDYMEVLNEEVTEKPQNEFIRNDGSVEAGMPIGSLFGVCPKHGVVHVGGVGCPSKQ